MAGALGATVSGIDLRKVTSNEQLDDVRQALTDHLVVFLPEQDIDLDDLERITDLLGGRDTTPYVTPLKDRPYVIRVIKEPGDLLNFANAWHSDLSYLPTPPSFTLLHAWDVPAFGGDTVWSNQYLAYETLSAGPPGDTGRTPGRALSRDGLRNRRAARPGEGPHVHGHRPFIRRIEGAGPSRRHHASIDQPQGALPQPRLYDQVRRLEPGRVAGSLEPYLPS